MGREGQEDVYVLGDSAAAGNQKGERIDVSRVLDNTQFIKVISLFQHYCTVCASMSEPASQPASQWDPSLERPPLST